MVRAGDTGRTQIVDLRQSGATKLVFPRQLRADMEVVLVNTAGGITGGDRYELEFAVGDAAALTLTTQAAERAYRAQRNETGRVVTRLHVGAGSRLHWLPQELILFDRAALDRKLRIDMEVGAQLVMVEPVVFGRAAMGETLREVQFNDRIRIMRAGRPLYLDAMQLRGDTAAHLARRAIAGGAGAVASVVVVRSDAQALLGPVRDTLPETAGASMIADDVLVIRYLASDSYDLRCHLLPVLDQLTAHTLPTSWRL